MSKCVYVNAHNIASACLVLEELEATLIKYYQPSLMFLQLVRI